MTWADTVSRISATAISRFGVTATYNGSTSVDGIFDNGYLATMGGDVDSTDPTFTCELSSIPAVANNDTLLINAITYVVVSIEPDGTGLVTLQLRV